MEGTKGVGVQSEKPDELISVCEIVLLTRKIVEFLNINIHIIQFIYREN